jgi:hypothetical protein
VVELTLGYVGEDIGVLAHHQAAINPADFNATIKTIYRMQMLSNVRKY